MFLKINAEIFSEIIKPHLIIHKTLKGFEKLNIIISIWKIDFIGNARLNHWIQWTPSGGGNSNNQWFLAVSSKDPKTKDSTAVRARSSSVLVCLRRSPIWSNVLETDKHVRLLKVD